MAELPPVSRWPGEDERLQLADGRLLQVRHFGARGGLPLFMLHGTPGARIMFSAMHAPALARSVHIIAVDRWAYGGTDAPPAPSLTGFAADIAEAADRLGLQRFAVAGVSGGGPYTTACAVHMPDRVMAAGLISPVGLVAEATRHSEVDLFHRFCFHMLSRAPRVVEALFKTYATSVRRSSGLACHLSTFRAPAADKAIMADCATSERLLAAFGEGLSRSARGPAIDLQMFAQIADLDLARATMPARVWIGSADRNVPIKAAHRLAHALPNADLVDIDGAGHLWVAHHYDAVLDWLTSVIGPQTTRAKAQEITHVG